ncbi:MAG TPA: inositol monophosphatase [Phycisphaerae bacterium]|nr:inositol monophosphatase [Phycisphaerae bacterium]
MASEINPAELRAAACDLARLGGRTAQELFGKVSMARKADDTPVTQADHAVQEAILAALASRYPLHGIVVEEQVARPERHAPVAVSEYCWVVDPIDGTRNFGRGSNVYSTSVAVLHMGCPLAGAIYDATSGQVFSASRGGGAFREDQRLTVVDRPIDYNTILALSSIRRRLIAPAVRAWMRQSLYRNAGSLCLHLIWVAAGCVDAAYAVECKVWDVAAGALLIQEAGGVITSPTGQPLWPIDLPAYRGQDIPILAGTPRMHAALLESLRNGGSGE